MTGARALLAIAFGAAAIVAGLLAPAWTHAPIALVVLLLARSLDDSVKRRLGRPTRWLVALALFALAGAWLGPSDARLFGLRLSAAGAWAAGTMLARAVGLVVVSSALVAWYPPARAIERLRGTRAARLGEVILVAVELTPTLIDALSEASRKAREQHPGVLRVPTRLLSLVVYAVEHAAELADSVARDLAAGPTSTTLATSARVDVEKE